MSDTSWPRVLDMSEDSARKALRSLEIAAYSSLLATFRAQGDLTPEKRAVLQQLRQLLGVTTERHRAELRRCVNDEKFTTIAYHMVGPNHDNEWLIEGRRLAPLSQRLALHTAFTATGNQAVAAQVEKNAMLPQPSQTGNREQFTAAATLLSPPPPPPVNPAALSPGLNSPNYLSNTAPVTKYSRAPSPNTNVVVLPSGTSIHIKGNVGTEDEEDITGTKRRRLASTDTTLATTKQIVGRGQPAPLKLTLNNKTTSVTSSSQKVILVQSSSGQVATTPSTASVKKTAANSSVPIVKSITPIISHTRTSVVYPASTGNDSTPISSGPTIHTHQGLTIQRPRAKATLTTTPRITSGVKPSITVSRHGVVIPANTGSISSPRAGIHVKQEGAMKIITTSNNKLMPRSSAANSTPIVVVTSSSGVSMGMSSAGSPSPNKHTVITRPGTGAVAINNNKVISIHTGSKLINASAGQKAVGLKAIGQKLASPIVKSSSSPVSSQTITTSTGKSGNVVIVQQGGQTATIKSTSGAVMGNKEFVSFIQKHGSTSEKTGTGTSIPTTIKALPTSPVAVNIKSSDFFPRTSFISGGNKSHSQVIVTPITSSDKLKTSQPSLTSSVSCSGKATPTWLQSTSETFTTASTIATSTNTVTGSIPVPSPPKIDIFSSALAEADINLDPYEFIDEDEPVVASTVTTPTSSIGEPPIWSGSQGDSTAGMYQLSQGAAILSGELPFLPASTTITSNAITSSYALSSPRDDSVIDTATTLIAQASNMLAQTTRVHTPTACVSNPITAAPLAPAGAQAILPKGKELIRILPVTPSGSSLLTNSSASVTRPHLTIKSRPSAQVNPKHVDIQPRGSSISSPPFIDAKILILPPGIAQPSTPVKEPSAELVDSLVQTSTDSAISTSLLNFAHVAASLQQQEQASAEGEDPTQTHESLTVSVGIGLPGTQSLAAESSSLLEPHKSLGEDISGSQGSISPPLVSNTEINAVLSGKEMRSCLSHSVAAESLTLSEQSDKTTNMGNSQSDVAYRVTDKNNSESDAVHKVTSISNIQSGTEVFRQNLLKACKLDPRDLLAKGKSCKLLTPRSNVLPWEVETSKETTLSEPVTLESLGSTCPKGDTAISSVSGEHLVVTSGNSNVSSSDYSSQSTAVYSKADPSKVSIKTKLSNTTPDLNHADLSTNITNVPIDDHLSAKVDAEESTVSSNADRKESFQNQSYNISSAGMMTTNTSLEEVSVEIHPVCIAVSQSSAISPLHNTSQAEELMQPSMSPHSESSLQEQPGEASSLLSGDQAVAFNPRSPTLESSLNQLRDTRETSSSPVQEKVGEFLSHKPVSPQRSPSVSQNSQPSLDEQSCESDLFSSDQAIESNSRSPSTDTSLTQLCDARTTLTSPAYQATVDESLTHEQIPLQNPASVSSNTESLMQQEPGEANGWFPSEHVVESNPRSPSLDTSLNQLCDTKDTLTSSVPDIVGECPSHEPTFQQESAPASSDTESLLQEQPDEANSLCASHQTVESNSISPSIDTSSNQPCDTRETLTKGIAENLSKNCTSVSASSEDHIASSTISTPEYVSEPDPEVKSTSHNVDKTNQDIPQHLVTSTSELCELNVEDNSHVTTEGVSATTDTKPDLISGCALSETTPTDSLESIQQVAHPKCSYDLKENESAETVCDSSINISTSSNTSPPNMDAAEGNYIEPSEGVTCLIKDSSETTFAGNSLSDNVPVLALTPAKTVCDNHETVAPAKLGNITYDRTQESVNVVSTIQNLDNLDTGQCSPRELNNSLEIGDKPSAKLFKAGDSISLSKEWYESSVKASAEDTNTEASVAPLGDTPNLSHNDTVSLVTDTCKVTISISEKLNSNIAVGTTSEDLNESVSDSHNSCLVVQEKSHDTQIGNFIVEPPISFSNFSHPLSSDIAVSKDCNRVADDSLVFPTHRNIDLKSDDSLSDSSPPLIAKRNFERVYRPRSSRSLSAIMCNNPESTISSTHAINHSIDNQSKPNGSEQAAFGSTECTTAAVSESVSNEEMLESTNISHQVDSPLLNGSKPSQEKEEAEDWLADSGHSLSNGPTSQGEESDGDESTTDTVIVNQGSEKVVRRGRKRRRRSDQSPSWSKAALGLLKRVMMYRGSNRNKGEHGAAAWFLKPVSDDEAPGYSEIISQPMDFGTIKRKLETNTYPDVESFKSDMLLIHSNCCKYNPPEHNVRRDCELVFIFFHQEYSKLLTRLQQAGSKKPKAESGSVFPT